MSSSDNVIIGNEARSAVETTLVHEPRNPRVFIRGCRPSTDDSILLIRYTAFWKQFLHHCCPLRDIVARGAGSTRRRFLPWTVTSIASQRAIIRIDWRYYTWPTWSSVNSVTWCNKFAKSYGGKVIFRSHFRSTRSKRKRNERPWKKLVRGFFSPSFFLSLFLFFLSHPIKWS